jgi:hypothetical protein
MTQSKQITCFSNYKIMNYELRDYELGDFLVKY